MPALSRVAAFVVTVLLGAPPLSAQQPARFTHADTLRGADTPERAWWDVIFYDLHVRVNPADSSILGSNGITYRVLGPARALQIDLQPPLVLDSAVQDGRPLATERDGSAYFVTPASPQGIGAERTVTVYYHGRWTARDPDPFHWTTDSLGAAWIATSDETLGASSWWPLKDFPGDEPDSQRIAVTVPDPMIDVSNGRLRGTHANEDRTTTYEWFVTEPINSYDVAINADQHYVRLDDRYDGEGGPLTLTYWPLVYHVDTARTQFRQTHPMLQCFEAWFGPYPWYADGYQLIEAPYLGMEHQSGIAYGNRYLPGYLGRDLSGTGVGLHWDYIIIHESAHEWWGNSISARDHADMWLHEGFAMYAEGLYTECQQGKDAATAYFVGLRPHVRNDVPIIGHYGVDDVPESQDRYYKGANMLHTVRQVINDDAKWRRILRGANRVFWHQTVWGAQVIDYISQEAGIDLHPVFAQYLTTTDIPVLEYTLNATTLTYRWTHVIAGFAMPVRVTLDGTGYTWIHPTETWQTATVHLPSPADFRVDPNFYVDVENVGARAP
jgi:aminopeptidase N